MSQTSSNSTAKIRSLHVSCLHVIVKYLERYPPEAMGILSQDEWESVVQLRHAKSTPHHKTSAGLDGTGRMVPAVSARFMTEMEHLNGHFRESTITDRLVWKDCVEHQFKRGGMLRPQALLVPWTKLVESIRVAQGVLEDCIVKTPTDPDESRQQLFMSSLEEIVTSPMNVALLQVTGIGKSVKKLIKACNHNLVRVDVVTERRIGRSVVSPRIVLEQTLVRWKNLPGITDNSGATTAIDKSLQQELDDLRIAQTCMSWRDLYQALRRRQETVRSNQGARMRQRRQNLSKDRPKIVKVRPTNARHSAMLQNKQMVMQRQARQKAALPMNKMQKLREESALAASWQKSSTLGNKRSAKTVQGKASSVTTSSSSSSFGAAVAFCSGDSKKKKRKHTEVIAMGGGKQMSLPKKVLKTGRGGVAVALKKKASRTVKR